MAYNLKNINTLDLKPSTAIGVAIPFNTPSVFTSVYTTKEQIKYNIINFLLTDNRERIFNPTFGAGLRSKLFEQITKESNEALKSSIRTSVEYYFPNIQIVKLGILSDPDSSTIAIQFSYRLLANNEEDAITLNIQNG